MSEELIHKLERWLGFSLPRNPVNPMCADCLERNRCKYDLDNLVEDIEILQDSDIEKEFADITHLWDEINWDGCPGYDKEGEGWEDDK